MRVERSREAEEIQGHNCTPLAINLNSAFVLLIKKKEKKKHVLKTSEIWNQIKMPHSIFSPLLAPCFFYFLSCWINCQLALEMR